MKRLFNLILGITVVLISCSTNSAALVSLYPFDGDFNDALANSLPLAADNVQTSGFSNGEWTWSGATSPGTGLILDADASVAANYSIGVRFEFDQVSNFRKVLDFKNHEATDQGLWFSNSRLEYFGNFSAIGSAVTGANQYLDLVVTRTSADNLFRVYVNGSSDMTIADNSSSAPTLVGGLARFRFFQDDDGTGEFTPGGTVREIRLWDAPLSASEVPNAFAPVPEPVSAIWVGGLIGAYAVGVRLKRLLGSHAKE